MDIETIDTQYGQLQTQSQQTVGALKALAAKLQTAAQAGNQDAREWLLDLREIALTIQAEQNQVANLLQSLHGFVQTQHNALSQPAGSVPQSGGWGAPQAPYPPQPYPPQPYPQQAMQPGGYPAYPAYGPGGGGFLGGLFNSGFGRAMLTGAGFGIGDDLINKIF